MNGNGYPVAGQGITLTCLVISNQPISILWRGPSVHRGNVSDVTVSGGVYENHLSFDSLRMSDAGLYSCLSKISHVDNNISFDTILLDVRGRSMKLCCV